MKKNFRFNEVLGLTVGFIVLSLIGNRGVAAGYQEDAAYMIGYVIGVLFAGFLMALIVEAIIAFIRSRLG